jgi:hypothetical protein
MPWSMVDQSLSEQAREAVLQVMVTAGKKVGDSPVGVVVI